MAYNFLRSDNRPIYPAAELVATRTSQETRSS